MNEITNSLNWYEIPVTDMQRAKHFYVIWHSLQIQKGTEWVCIHRTEE